MRKTPLWCSLFPLSSFQVDRGSVWITNSTEPIKHFAVLLSYPSRGWALCLEWNPDTPKFACLDEEVLYKQISTAYIENRLEGLKLCKRLKLSENWVEPSSFLPYTAWVQVGPTALIENLMISVRCFRHIVKFRGRASESLTFNLIVFFTMALPWTWLPLCFGTKAQTGLNSGGKDLASAEQY